MPEPGEGGGERDALADVIRTLREPPPIGAEFDARVMNAVRRDRPPGVWARAWEWLGEPRTVAFSPAAGLAMAAGLLLVVAATLRLIDQPTGGGAVAGSAETQDVVNGAARPVAMPAPASAQRIRFVLYARDAGRVALVGDFNGWDASATPLRRAATAGVWTVEVPLVPGRYTYAFLVDGTRWVADPAAPRAVGDDFGTPSSAIQVPATSPGGSSL
jgi:hypothetical protein